MSLDVLSRDYDGGSPDIPEATGDVYRAGDLMRDLHYAQDKTGRALADLLAVAKPYISGGVVTKGTGDTLDITPAVGYVPFQVKVPDSYASNPPTVKNEDTYRRVASTQQTNMAVAGATLDGGTVNYVKLAYAETDGPTRARLKASGTYVYVKVDSFVITVTPVAGTAYELVLATFTGTGGGAFTITDLTPDFTDFARSLGDDVDAATYLTTLGFSAFIAGIRADADAAARRVSIGAASEQGYMNLSMTNIDSTSEPTFTGGVEVNGTQVTLSTESGTGWGGLGTNSDVWAYVTSAGAVVYSATDPAWDSAKGGWYNSNDRAVAWMRKDGGDAYRYKHFLPTQQQAGIFFEETKITIGTWNMNSVDQKSVQHQLTYGSIIYVEAWIRDDSPGNPRPLHDGASESAYGWFSVQVGALIILDRGSITGANWSSTGFDRGWVNIRHQVL